MKNNEIIKEKYKAGLSNKEDGVWVFKCLEFEDVVSGKSEFSLKTEKKDQIPEVNKNSKKL